MKMLEDDVYSFGFILLEALVGPSLSAKSEVNVLNVMVCAKMFGLHDIFQLQDIMRCMSLLLVDGWCNTNRQYHPLQVLTMFGND